MKEKTTATHVLGVDRDEGYIRGVVLVYKRGKAVCTKRFYLYEERSEAINSFQMTEEGRKLLREADHALVIVGMDGFQTITRQLEVKLKREKDIDAVLAFQAEPLLPFPLTEGFVDRIIADKYNDSTLLTLLAARQDHIQEQLEQWQELGLNPEVVSSLPLAMAVCGREFLPKDSARLLLYLGWRSCTCAIIHKGELVASQSFRGGLDALKTAYERDGGAAANFWACDYSESTSSALGSTAQQLKRDLVRTAFGLAKYAHIDNITSLTILGEGSRTPSLGSFLSAALNKPLQPLSADVALQLGDAELALYAVPVGLALTALPNAKTQIDFRQGEMAYPYPWKRLWKPVITTVALCLMLAYAVYLLGNSYLNWKESLLRSQYVGLLADVKRDYNAIEEKLGAAPALPESLTPEDVAARLTVIEREEAALPSTIALFANVPRVSDVLAWLSTLPQITFASNQGNGEAQIHLETFNYRLLKRPELTKPKDRYQVQVELEFTSRSARAARLFYDAIIAPNDIVDPKGEVKWSPANGRYRIAFFLKDKSSYP